MNASDFRRIVLGMAGAEERSHMNHPDFRANGRIFATLNEDETRGMVILTPELQTRFMRTSGTFEPAAGAWGRQGCTMIDLRAADEEVVGEAVTLAWQLSEQKAAARRSKGKPTAKRTAAAKTKSAARRGPKKRAR